jgi:hypothetical protein
MFFKKMRTKVASIIPHGVRPEKESRKRRGSIEKILRAEYQAAEAELDRTRTNPGMKSDIEVYGKRYMEATVRLRRFLAQGEVPRDVIEKLTSE